jgi:major vault protein
MIYGPCSFIPPTQVTVVEVRKSIPLHLNEGVYVRDTKTGAVRAVFGTTYML